MKNRTVQSSLSRAWQLQNRLAEPLPASATPVRNSCTMHNARCTLATDMVIMVIIALCGLVYPSRRGSPRTADWSSRRLIGCRGSANTTALHQRASSIATPPGPSPAYATHNSVLRRNGRSTRRTVVRTDEDHRLLLPSLPFRECSERPTPSVVANLSE